MPRFMPPRKIKTCKGCDKVVKEQRDNASPYCDKCDPNGTRFFYDKASS